MDSILKCYIDIPFDCGSVHIRLIGVRIHVISSVKLDSLEGRQFQEEYSFDKNSMILDSEKWPSIEDS